MTSSEIIINIESPTPPSRRFHNPAEDLMAQPQEPRQSSRSPRTRRKDPRPGASPTTIVLKSKKGVQGQNEEGITGTKGDNRKKYLSMDPSVLFQNTESPDDIMDLGSDKEGGITQQSSSDISEMSYDADDEDGTNDTSTSLEKIMNASEDQKNNTIIRREDMDAMSVDSGQEEQGGKRRNLKRNNDNDDTNLGGRKLRKVEDGGPDENELEMDIDDISSLGPNITAAQLRPTRARIEAPELVPGGVRPTPLTWMTYKDFEQEIVQFQPRGFHHPRQPISGYTYAPCNSYFFAKRWCERECEAWKLMWDLEDVPPGWLCEFFEDILPGVHKPVREGMMATAFMYRAIQLVCFRYQHETMIIDLALRVERNPKFLQTISPSYRHYLSKFSYFRRFQTVVQVDGKTKEITLARPIASRRRAEIEMRNRNNNKNRKKRGFEMSPTGQCPPLWDRGVVFPFVPDYPYTFESYARYDPMHPFRMNQRSTNKVGIPPMKYGYEEWIHLIKLMHKREGGSLSEPHKYTQWRNRCITIHEKAQGDTKTDLCGLLQECEGKMIGMRSSHMVEDCAEVEIYGICICGPLAMMVRLRRNHFVPTDVYNLGLRGHQKEFLWLVVNAVADVFWKENVLERGGTGGFPGPGLGSNSGVPGSSRKAVILVREDLHEDTDIEDETMSHQDNDSDDGIDNVSNNDYEPYVDELEEEYYEYEYGEDDGSEEIDGSGDKKDH
ncbi:hypothetical protein AOL_s00215g350 [Orbilia oligospora ATCC 24927]|uniref:Uncharacterized protein n=1 Tax=Arthrobotrys oligospora (strain ATCC 24927 / CBS 115.81 / DSM 1491) TaxID=756982 RepID=G1XU71_ARTOA|nr:hypothetical protein AOL_s00215g350 [Orbilia oligospora ATCC 24927]EGX43614.1 hypothetical protein AOL_s00215g350 [Orbilia oligospora ATCC 24927]